MAQDFTQYLFPEMKEVSSDKVLLSPILRCTDSLPTSLTNCRRFCIHLKADINRDISRIAQNISAKSTYK